MKHGLGQRVLWATAAVALMAGAFVTARSLAMAAGAAERMARKADEIEALRTLQADDAAVRADVAALEALGEDALRSPAVLPALMAASAKPDDVRTETRAFGDGWTEVTATVSYREASLREALALADAASAARPPWRLASCDIRAAPAAAGTAQLTLGLATVRRGGTQGEGTGH